MKKVNDTIWDRTCDLLIRSAVPWPLCCRGPLICWVIVKIINKVIKNKIYYNVSYSKRMEARGLDWSGWGRVQMMGWCEHCNEIRLAQIEGISWLAEKLAGVEEGMCSVELVVYYLINLWTYREVLQNWQFLQRYGRGHRSSARWCCVGNWVIVDVSRRFVTLLPLRCE
jgi:hypothetical protein